MMPQLEYSKLARLELINIIEYTRGQWSDTQAQSYLNSLEATFHLLAQYPSMGRSFSARFRQWRRFEHKHHVILYQPIQGGVRIERIFHERQLLAPELR